MYHASFRPGRLETRAAFLRNELESFEDQLSGAKRIIAKGAPPTSDVQARFAYVQAQERLLTLPSSIDVLKRSIARHGVEVR